MAVKTLQVTIGAAVTPIIASGEIIAQWVIFQNNATHNMRVGDSNVTMTVATSPGIQLASGSPGGAGNPPPSAPTSKTRLSKWYVGGTQNDVLDVIYEDGQ